MPGDPAGPDHPLLFRVVRQPALLAHLPSTDISRAIDTADRARLLGWILARLDEHLPLGGRPGWLDDKLTTATGKTREFDRALRWEIDRLSRIFSGEQLRWVLLKGAGYFAAGLGPGRGRRVADVDLLVPRDDVARAEQLLKAHGWTQLPLDPYDEHYYREWMHEQPPLFHPDRGAVVDLHHAILPKTARLQPDSVRLLAQARTTASGVLVLSPSHMVLHAAAHLFHDGEVAGAIRDLVDLDALLRDFGRDSAFWPDLAIEAKALGLTRPAYYALRHSRRLLGTPLAPSMDGELARWAPPSSIDALMDALVERAVSGAEGPLASSSAFALYVRAHWLRMPPAMLVKHLWHKAFLSPA